MPLSTSSAISLTKDRPMDDLRIALLKAALKLGSASTIRKSHLAALSLQLGVR
jgi:hypothetical protein